MSLLKSKLSLVNWSIVKKKRRFFSCEQKLIRTKMFSTILGNPLTCDCETLWLRNWASDEKNVIQDDPICYFPPQLSGNNNRNLFLLYFTLLIFYRKSFETIEDIKIHLWSQIIRFYWRCMSRNSS